MEQNHSLQTPLTIQAKKLDNPRLTEDTLTLIQTPEDFHRAVSMLKKLSLAAMGFHLHEAHNTLCKWNELFIGSDVAHLSAPLITLCAVELLGRGSRYHTLIFVIKGVDISAVQALFQLPLTYVGYNLNASLCKLLSLGISLPRQIWDVKIAEKVFCLGKFHHSYYSNKADADLALDERLSLQSCCRRYHISRAEHAYALPSAFVCAHSVEIVISLYFKQVEVAQERQVFTHLTEIEMPWMITQAGMISHGIRIDIKKGRIAQQAAKERASVLLQKLQQMGINNPASIPQWESYFTNLGLVYLFKQNNRYIFDKAMLKRHASHHPSIALLKEYRQVSEWLDLDILREGFLGPDSRIHPTYIQLGAVTGRQTCNSPNVLNLSREKRNLVIPPEGYGIGEVDQSQIEAFIAGAIYQDQNLIEMCNSDDLYSSMAKQYYRDQLDDSARQMCGSVFKKQYSLFRNTMKTCTLALLYGYTAYGLAQELQCPLNEAAALLQNYQALFPELATNQQRVITEALAKGYSKTVTGLRRYRQSKDMPLDKHEKNWLINFPVQGTAAALFKEAGNRIAQQLPQYDAHLLIPLHDSYIFEAPLAHLKTVAELIERELCQTVRSYFPELRPRVEINIEHPECWNKEGDVEALDRWIAEINH